MADQLSFEDLWFAEEDFRTFITRLEAFRSEIARLNEEIGTLRDEYRDLVPVRALETAYGIAAKRKKLTTHKTDATSYDAQIRALEIARDDATAALTFQIETRKAVIRPLILERGETLKVDGLTAQYVKRQGWDTALLLAMAEEIPAIKQAWQETPYVAFR